LAYSYCKEAVVILGASSHEPKVAELDIFNSLKGLQFVFLLVKVLIVQLLDEGLDQQGVVTLQPLKEPLCRFEQLALVVEVIYPAHEGEDGGRQQQLDHVLVGHEYVLNDPKRRGSVLGGWSLQHALEPLHHQRHNEVVVVGNVEHVLLVRLPE
jgi:hypothetical protein